MRTKVRRKKQDYPVAITGGQKKGPWYEWLNSPEGKGCADGTTHGQWLENRLWYAFVAGMKAGWAQAEAAEREERG